MVIVTVIYPKTPDSYFKFDYYLKHHTPLVRERLKSLGLEDLRLMQGKGTLDGGKPAFEVMAQLSFTSGDHLQRALAAHGAEIMGDIPNFTNVQPAIQVSEPLA